MPNGKKKTEENNLQSSRYVRRRGSAVEIMPDGSERQLSEAEYSTSPANAYYHRPGSLGSKNNNPHRVGTRQAFDWDKKYGDTPPEITMSENAPSAAKLRNLDQMDMLDFKNEEYIKEQRRQSGPLKSIYNMTENVGDKVVNRFNVLSEKGQEKLDQANTALKEKSEQLKSLGSNVRKIMERKQ